MSTSNLKEKIFKALKANYPISGLEISDSVLRLASLKKGDWNLATLRLPPGILVDGKIQNEDEFVSALKSLRTELEVKPRIKVPVVVSLSSLKIYAQTISIPILEESKLENALDLNLELSSPAPFSEVYPGTELIRRDEERGKMEYLAAFIDRDAADQILKLLGKANFIAVAMEPGSISLTRLIKKASYFDFNKSYLVTSLDSNGLNFLIVRNGALHFDYFNSWNELQQVDGQISTQSLFGSLTKGLNQVINFYKSQWTEPIDSIMLISSGLNADVKSFIESNFPFKVQEVKLEMGDGVSNEWAVAMGAGFRGLTPRNSDNEMNLMGWDAKEAYRREQILRFVSYWRTIVPTVMGVVILSLLGGYLILKKAETGLRDGQSIRLTEEQKAEINELDRRVNEFNRSVAMITALQSDYSPRLVDLVVELRILSEAKNVTLNRISYGQLGGPVSISGEAKLYEDIIAFRKSLEENPKFSNVSLPFTNIQQSPQGFVFSATLSFKSPNTP